MAIRTIEDGYQYRVNKILNKLKTDWDISEDEFMEWIERPSAMQALGRAFLDDIDSYCGIEDALNNDH